jgi:amino acid adenylation domain-containing protein
MADNGNGKLVGLMTNQGPNTLVGLLAIMKAGKGFVPIDPRYPAERISLMIRDCGIDVLLTEQNFKDKVSGLLEAGGPLKRIIWIDEFLSEARETQVPDSHGYNIVARSRKPALESDQLLYVIYTSGSTGIPKGVPITHRNLVPMLLWSREYFNLGENTRVLQNLSYTFDFGVYEILTTIAFGGTLFFLDRYEISDSSHYSRLVREQSVNTVHSTPTFFKEVIASGDVLESLEVAHLGGEELTIAAVESIATHVGPDCVFYNGYGPTEVSVNSSVYAVGKASELYGHSGRRSSAVPIGRASANNRLYVVDQNFEPYGIGLPGELLVGGIGVSEGYQRRPEQTAERFIPDPFSEEPGSRLYRTGDLVRYLPDYNIEFLGRIDNQVKVRGVRIELGEIESALLSHPSVREAAVVAREDRPGQKHLVAYFVPEGQPPTHVELRDFLKGRLPDYLVPPVFAKVDAMPLTVSGKIDRLDLPVPESNSFRSEQILVPAKTNTERLVANIWVRMLNVGEVGLEDNFFHLGGHSLLATQLMSRIKDVFKIELPLRTIFDEPTVARLARRIDAKLDGDERLAPGAINPVTINAEGTQLSFSQQRLWYLDQLEPGNVAYNIPISLHLSGGLNPEALAQSISSIVHRHSVLRACFRSINGEVFQIVEDSVAVGLPLINMARLPMSQREALVEMHTRAEARRPFDLSTGPLIRGTLMRLSPSEHVLLLTQHHIISDGWSMGIFFAELEEFYRAFSSGRCSGLPQLEIQYADFALWQRDWLMNGALERQLSYWRKQLLDAPSVLTIAGDRPRQATQTYAGAYETMELSEELSRRIEAMSKRVGVTPFVSLLTAFKALICRCTGSTDIVVGTSIANRNQIQTESLIGFFVNTLVLRTKCDGDPSLSELLRRVRDTALGAYDHQDVPFEKLIEELRPERDLRFNPIFQMAFEFQSSPARIPELPGLRIRPMDVDAGASHFDLTLGVANDIKGFCATIEYNTDLFDSGTIAQLLEDYRALLESASAATDQTLSMWLSAAKTEVRTGLDSELRMYATGGTSGLEREVTLRRATLAARRAKLSTEKLGWLERHVRGE